MPPRPTIALATSAEMPKPDPESHLLVAALAQRGIDARLIPWDSQVDWPVFPLVLVRTPWDYFRRLPQFLAWAEQVQARTLLLNPCAVLAWNSHKRYLRQLAQQGLATVPTLWLDQDCADGAARQRVGGTDWLSYLSNFARRLRPNPKEQAARPLSRFPDKPQHRCPARPRPQP